MEKSEALKLLSVLTKPDRIKIILILLEKESSFGEIKQKLGETYNTGLLFYNLKQLEKHGLITNKKRLDLASKPPKFSFYQLTPKGRIIAYHLVLCLRELSQID